MNSMANIWKLVAFLIALTILMVVHGAIPFYTLPTLVQSVWLSGWAESFVNNSWKSLYAVNFGIPNDAPIAFGLPGALLQSFFIGIFNMYAADAYTFGIVVWLALALWGSYKLTRFVGAGEVESLFLSLAYLTHPIIWWHAEYSMVSVGFALLPLYLYMGFELIQTLSAATRFSTKVFLQLIGFFCTTLLSVFTDGYTFVMFFVASLVIWGTTVLEQKRILVKVLLFLLASFLISYMLYTKYIGVSDFPGDPIEVFRAMGVDLITLVIPTQNVMWIWDGLHISESRTTSMFYGDGSNWISIFALPTIILGGLGFWFANKKRGALAFFLIALAGLYFSLGPSLKINSLREQGDNEGLAQVQWFMPEDAAIFPTGSAYLYNNVPGFKNMRYPYRWVVLMLVGLYGLVVLFFIYLKPDKKMLAFFLVSLVIVSNFPNISNRLKNTHAYRNSMIGISEYFFPLSERIGNNSTVLFAPPGNDMLVNYLASDGNYRAYNVGGDKNLFLASKGWPDGIKAISKQQVGNCLGWQIGAVLLRQDVDFVVLPYFETYRFNPDILTDEKFIESRKKEHLPLIEYFEISTNFNVEQDDLYAIISLKPGVDTKIEENQILKFTEMKISDDCSAHELFLPTNGWYAVENWGVWSSENASIKLNLPEECYSVDSHCQLRLVFQAFNASRKSPKNVHVHLNETLVETWRITSSDFQDKLIKLSPSLLRKNDGASNTLEIFVPGAESPGELGLSTDYRVLGIGLREIALTKE